MIVDLSKMPSGDTYENTYGLWLQIFKGIATAPKDQIIQVKNPPKSWLPLLWYLDCKTVGAQYYFDVADYNTFTGSQYTRTIVEALCGLRPELVDALWKIDNEWEVTHVRELKPEKEFVITNNGSFFRQEIKAYNKALAEYKPTKDKIIIMPCAADKPPPSPMQKAVIERAPEGYYVAIVTGALGLVPQDLWDVMPWYDAGLPNHYNVLTKVMEYFIKHPHSRVLVYDDFYSQIIQWAFRIIGHSPTKVDFIFEPKVYINYLDLLDPANLAKLEEAVKQ